MSTTAKKIDKSVVQHHAEALMNKNGNTTTLDVKNALRAANYWAEQSEVSDYMRQLASELDWDYTSNGSYNTYYPATTATAPSTTASTSTSASTPSASTAKGVIAMIEKLFAIHKYAMTDKSRIGTDLGLTPIQIEDLALEVEKELNLDIPVNLKTPDTTVGDIQKFLDGAKGQPKTGRVKIDIDPKEELGGTGATNDEIKDLVSAGKVDENDWILSLGAADTRMIYAGDETRDHVRTAFARKIGDRIQNTRARRVKNIL